MNKKNSRKIYNFRTGSIAYNVKISRKKRRVIKIAMIGVILCICIFATFLVHGVLSGKGNKDKEVTAKEYQAGQEFSQDILNDINNDNDVNDDSNSNDVNETNEANNNNDILAQTSEDRDEENGARVNENDTNIDNNQQTTQTIEQQISEVQLANRRVKLDVECILQKPELPTGCEITSLATVLNYNGFDISKTELADKYLEKTSSGDFHETFVGNPFSVHGYGCYAKPIVKAANNYFSDIENASVAINVSYSSIQQILSIVEKGQPVLVWATMGMKEAYTTSSWTVGNKTVTWIAPEHCVVLTGYDLDKKEVYTSDPLVGSVARDMEVFFERNRSIESQAVYLKIN